MRNTQPLWKLSTEFPDIRDWRNYVRANAPADEVNYILARGRTQLFLRFYKVRGVQFPMSFEQELAHIERSVGLSSARELEDLNERVLADLKQVLFTMLPQRKHDQESVVPTSPTDIVEELEEHLRTANTFFALWVRYQALECQGEARESWVEFATRECPSQDPKDLQFAHMMSQLGALLRLYREGSLPLPPRTRYVMWYLHYVEQPIRNTQTRVLLGTLLEGLRTCGSA